MTKTFERNRPQIRRPTVKLGFASTSGTEIFIKLWDCADDRSKLALGSVVRRAGAVVIVQGPRFPSLTIVVDSGGLEMLRSFKAMLETYKEKDIVRAYHVGCGICALVVIGVTTYDIHRSIKANDKPPSREQLESLVATIDNSRQAGQMPYDDLVGQTGKNSREDNGNKSG